MCYVLIGFWSTPEEDLMRVQHLWDDYKIHPFVMPYNKFNRYQKDFARWCNNKVIFKSCTWDEYIGEKYKKKDLNKNQKNLGDYI